MTNYTVRRGYGGKPWITTDGLPLDWPDGESRPLNAELYERVSELAGALDTKENLSPYHQAQAVLGMMRETSLALQFRALASEFRDPWNEAKAEVKQLLGQARAAGGEDRKSGIGTGLHRYAHLVDIGQEVEFPTPALEPWLQCYRESMKRFEVLGDEWFVACDEVKAAGSFDRLLRDRESGEVLIGDIKGGKSDPDFPMKVMIQVAMYAHGVRYDQETGERTPVECSQTSGVLIHVPVNGSGKPRCDLYRLDLVKGWELAKMAATVMEARRVRLGVKDRLR